MNRFFVVAIFILLFPFVAFAADEPKAPGTVKELFADYDPRKDPLDTKLVREWGRSPAGLSEAVVARKLRKGIDATDHHFDKCRTSHMIPVSNRLNSTQVVTGK